MTRIAVIRTSNELRRLRELADREGCNERTLVQLFSGCSVRGLFFSIAGGALKRGYNALIFDGPGQGGALVMQKLPMRADWENVVAPVVD